MNKFDIAICDRSVVDIIAYTRLINEKVADDMFAMIMDGFIETYDVIYFKKIQYNDFLVYKKIQKN